MKDSAKKKYFYQAQCSPDEEDTEDNYSKAYSLHDNPEWIAEDCAKQYWEEFEGWEASWPLFFIVRDANMQLIGKFEISLDFDPVFHAGKVE